MAFIRLLWEAHWIIIAAVVFWVSYHRQHMTEAICASIEQWSRLPGSSVPFSDEVPHLSWVVFKQVAAKWQSVNCKSKHVFLLTTSIVCRSQPISTQYWGWTSPCGFYYDCKTPSAIPSRNFETNKIYCLQVLESTQQGLGERERENTGLGFYVFTLCELKTYKYEFKAQEEKSKQPKWSVT